MEGAVLVLGIAAVVGVVGIGLGMLVARALQRLADRSDEEPGGDDRSDD
ncbi:MAG TPA: hypothetical protein VD763_06815 [Candidatus Saccharimonadales bacterium]|nr:hypothetical protein [Candidatus Saccharimonadales bacterium]